MGDESQPTHEVFISYSSKDKKWADAACAVLERHRIRCWVAPRDIIPGTEWGAAIISGMDASKIMVLIFSTHANQSAQVRREVERAISKGMIVLPFRVEDVKPAGAMEFALSNTHWLDGFTPPVERHLDFLARSVSSLLTKDRDETPELPDRPAIVPVPSRPYGRLLVAGGLAVLMVIIVAGLLLMFRGRTVQPVPDTAAVEARSPKPAPPSQRTERPSAQPSREWTNSIGMKFVRIEPGTFQMGTTDDQVEMLMRFFPDTKRVLFDHGQPQHPVKITRPFLLGVHEVTQGQYQAVMGKNPSNFKGSDDLPVEQVSWLDAVQFCNRLSERDGRKPYYRVDGADITFAGGNGYRLPTEAEWEHACRAGTTTIYPFGDDAGALGEYGWCSSNSQKKTHPVGQKRPNAWGLYDMLGNVWEWCADWYDEKYYGSSPATDPPGPGGASHRVVRGGAWFSGPWYCRPAVRRWSAPENRHDSRLGFRVVAVQE